MPLPRRRIWRPDWLPADPSESVAAALAAIVAAEPNARVLICGSLYLAGRILQENG